MPSHISDRILQAAVELFSQRGFVGTSTKEIAKAARVNETSIFRLFGDKEGLHDAAIEQMAAWMDAVCHEAKRLGGGELARDAQAFGRICFRQLTPKYMRFWAFASLERPEKAWEKLHGRLLPLRLSVTDRVRREIQTGKMRKLRPEAAAGALLGAIFYHAYFLYINRAGDEPAYKVRENDVDVFVDIWLKGLQS